MIKFLALIAMFSLISFKVPATDFDNTNLSSNDVAHIAQPYVYENNEIAVITITSDTETLRKLVPEPLVPNTTNTIYLYIGEFNLKHPQEINYREAGLLIPVTFKDKNKTEHGSYFPVLYLDHIDAIIGGREVYGFPKFLADITFTRNNKSIHGLVKIDGETIIEADFNITTKVENPFLPNWNMYSLKRIPGPNLQDGNAIKQIISAPQNGIKIHEMHLATATLKLHSTDKNPLGAIPIVKTSDPFVRIENMTINEGKVLHDFLLEQK